MCFIISYLAQVCIDFYLFFQDRNMYDCSRCSCKSRSVSFVYFQCQNFTQVPEYYVVSFFSFSFQHKLKHVYIFTYVFSVFFPPLVFVWIVSVKAFLSDTGNNAVAVACIPGKTASYWFLFAPPLSDNTDQLAKFSC